MVRTAVAPRRGHVVDAPTVWPPPSSSAQVARAGAEVLRGVRFRRRVLWRYSLTWTKPHAASER